jgi:transcriptional regulator with XRE-family HTH domain
MPKNRASTAADLYIGGKIRGYRNQRGISQDELGQMLGVSFQQVQKYEKGVNRVTGARLLQMAGVFECDITDLLPDQQHNGKKMKLSNVDRVVATRDGIKLIDSFVTIKNENLRAAVVDLARRFEGL